MEFRMAEHSACLQEGQTEVQRQSAHRAEEALAATIAKYTIQGAR